MPYVNLKISTPEPSEAQLRQVVEEFTDTVARVLNKNPADVMVYIDITPPTALGFGGKTLQDIRDGK
ncbi:Tautomerase enzyme [Bibersteinia trehalosi USDA-ARS-USMARC-188]|uniref:Tautomerase enzyme n=3 Tax=Bibersteinia trehalosi TaxID=47735 RepID=W0R3K3_BIBTR|nr:4-oxalocrotonate tautomerase family protein [Bibersteinia trehalosi]AGH37415.1 Tautomerase enzyme [Bibersteinia trehalosi USDA-ARS-USMARC-192]AHG82776.1 Tautomerase enzyme [Bibersteinia trehalosi USDA-ARS-USMARC-188]AHG85112.1 Tautomerase enzyme [Bibersteinia trehalosi USDA-ARS-USMARC-189]AHG85321.1 Tautomerase enzyme [Bibersteinia trehalosi USDA-ARS-USMARC-190]